MRILKKAIFIVLSVVLMIILFSVLVFIFWPKIRLADRENSATLIFKTYGCDIEVALSVEDFQIIKEIFNGNRWYKTNSVPSCGHTKAVSILIGDEYFCPACDGCNTIYCYNQERYFSLYSEEVKKLHEIFAKYGGVFPCV